MVKRLAFIPFVFLLLVSQVAFATEFTASVDRTEISQYDTITLKLRLNEQVFRGQPDLAPLETDFSIQGQQRSQQFRSINGKTESYTEWNIGLLPRRTGTLTIPSISFKGEKSAAIEITVSEPSANIVEQTERNFFFDVQVTPIDNAIVQGQLLYKEKLYYGVDHTDANLPEFKIDNARVQSLGSVKQYTTVIEGRRFGVYERNYAIFPEMAGELVIPAQTFRANIPNPYDRWSRGKAINIASDPISVQVAAIPAEYPNGVAWLPTSELIVDESFSKAPTEWQVGDAVTRTITIQANGIPGKQLPEVSLPTMENFRYYPDQINHDENITERGIIGYSEQSVAIVASSGGEFTLPEVRIPWWNTNTNSLEYAVLPEHKILVSGAVITKTTEPSVTSNDIDAIQAENNKAKTNKHSLNQESWFSWLVLTLLGFSLVLNIILFVSRKPKEKADTAAQSNDNNQESLKPLWAQFSQACKDNRPAQVRQTLIAWVQAGGLPTVTAAATTLSSIAQQVSDSTLANALLDLDKLLYGEQNNADFSAASLKSLVEKEAKKKVTIKNNNGLYPNI